MGGGSPAKVVHTGGGKGRMDCGELKTSKSNSDRL